MSNRICGECTICCEGWLTGQVNGHSFYPGRPCFFLGKTCTIYENRPQEPCRAFKCSWLAEETFPVWMRPDLSGVIITKREQDGFEFYFIKEAGSVLNSKTLNWLVHWSLNTNTNILYQIDGGINKIGSKEFVNSSL